MAKIRPTVRGFGPVAPGGGAAVGAALQGVGKVLGALSEFRTNRELLGIREQEQVDALEFKQFEKVERSEAMSQIIIKQIARNEATAQIIAEAKKARNFEDVQGAVDTFESDHNQNLFEDKSELFQQLFLSMDQPRRLGNINKTGTAVEAGRLGIIVDNFLTSSRDIIKTAADSSPFSIIEDFRDHEQFARSMGIKESLIESTIGRDRRAAMDRYIGSLPILEGLAALNDEDVVAAYTTKELQIRRNDQLSKIKVIQDNEVVLDAANLTLTGISLTDQFSRPGSTIASIQEDVRNAGLPPTQEKRMLDRVTAMALARKAGKRKVDPEVVGVNEVLIAGEVELLVNKFLSDSVDEELAEDPDARAALLLQHANDAEDLYSQAAIMVEKGEFGAIKLARLKFKLNEITGPLLVTTKVAEKGFLSKLSETLVAAAAFALSPALALSLRPQGTKEDIQDPVVANALISKEIRLMNIGQGRFVGFSSSDKGILETFMIDASINTPGFEQPMAREEAFSAADKVMSSALTRLFREVKGMNDEAIAETMKTMANGGTPATEERTTVPISDIAGKIQANLDRGMTLDQIEEAALNLTGFDRRVFDSAVATLSVEDRLPQQGLTDTALSGELGTLRGVSGTISTEISVTVEDDRLNGGRPTNIPTLVEGQVDVQALVDSGNPTDEQVEIAIKRAVERQAGGQLLPSFDSIDQAVNAARDRHEQEGLRVNRT